MSLRPRVVLALALAALPPTIVALLALFLLMIVRSAGTSPTAFLSAAGGLLLGTAVVVVLAAHVLSRDAPRDVPAAREPAPPSSREQRFVANAAHELRTPITVLRALADQALARERPAPEYRRALEEIAEESRRAGELVESLLELARLDTGAFVLDDEISVTALAEEVVRLASARFPARPIGLRKSGEAKLRGNATLLSRGVLNLVLNAVKYAGPSAEVTVFVETHADCVLVGVDDSGPGIPGSDRERLLGRFERGAAPAGSGIGLGLPIADGIARAHRGSLEIGRSEAGGCRAALSLPTGPRGDNSRS